MGLQGARGWKLRRKVNLKARVQGRTSRAGVAEVKVEKGTLQYAVAWKKTNGSVGVTSTLETLPACQF